MPLAPFSNHMKIVLLHNPFAHAPSISTILNTPLYRTQIDYIAASFVRKASDVNEIRAYVKELMAESSYPANHPHPKIISKIESTEVLYMHTCHSYNISLYRTKLSVHSVPNNPRPLHLFKMT